MASSDTPQQPIPDPLQLPLLPDLPAPHFDGPVYEPKHDQARLTGQIQRIYQAVLAASYLDQWLTLGELAERTGDPEASISAQLRHLRKPRFGSHVVDKRRRGAESSGLWEYRMILGND
jgi:hypothetical protein